MPTGYTSKIYEGVSQTFGEFALACARNFGALVEMRDEPMDAPIPFEFQPSPYHSEALRKAQEHLGRLVVMSTNEAAELATKEFTEAEKSWKESRAKQVELRARYNAMLTQVTAWQPPTEEHKGLKEFMTDQLLECLRSDCATMRAYPTQRSGAEWLKEQRDRATKDIDYHTKQLAEERKRAQERTAWVRALRASL